MVRLRLSDRLTDRPTGRTANPLHGAVCFSAGQEFKLIFWTQNIHYRGHNNLPLIYILNHINSLKAELNPICCLLVLLGAHHILHVNRIRVNPAHALPDYSFRNHFDIILPSTTRSWKLSFQFRLPHQHPITTSPLHHTFFMSCPSHQPSFGHPTNTWWKIQITSFFFANTSTVVPDAFFSTLFFNSISPRSWLYVSDQVSHPYKATEGIIVLYVPIFIFLHAKRDDDIF